MKIRFNLTQLIAVIFFFGLLVIGSCKKEHSQSAADEEQASMASSESDAEAEGIYDGFFDDAMGVSDEVGVAGSGVFYGRSNNTGDPVDLARGDTLTPVARCFTVTVTHPNTTPFPVRVVIDFGTAGCTGPDGHKRRGKIIIEYTNRLIYPGAVATTTFDGFYIDEIKVEGTHIITNTSSVNTTPPVRQYTIDVLDAKLTKPDGNFTEWTSHKTITQIEGVTTVNPRDDVFRIEGNGHGRVRRGTLLVAWESAITEPLIKRFTCRWIVRGRIRTVRINATVNSPWVAVLDFGNGDCDNQAVITINGRSHQITLP